MILLDVTNTCHCWANTGIQRVARSLYRELLQLTEILPICFDPYMDEWRALTPAELALLEPPKSTNWRRRRGAKWSLQQRLRGFAGRLDRAQGRRLQGTFSGLIVPEIFDHSVGQAYARLFSLVNGPKIAFFHDIIPIKLKHFTPVESVRQFPQYLQDLKAFDTIITNSHHTCNELLAYWNARLEQHPPVAALPLGVDIPAATLRRSMIPPEGPIEILSVGTLECRKNHLMLLAAAEWLFFQGLEFELNIIGMLNRETGRPALDRILQMNKKGLPVFWKGAVSEAALIKAYRECNFTVYPSLAEGFGLPVAESISYGKPCVCSNRGALGEIAQGGGCLIVDTSSVEELARGIELLITQRAQLQKLQREAANHRLKTWTQFAQELLKHFSVQAPQQKLKKTLLNTDY